MDKVAKIERVQHMEVALREAAQGVRPGAEVRSRAMFGGAGFYVDGVMVAAWFGNELALKLPEEARAELLMVSGAMPSQSTQYIELPPAFVQDTTLLEPWLARSLAYATAQGKRGRMKQEK